MSTDLIAGLFLGLVSGIACYELGLSVAERAARKQADRALVRARLSALPRPRW